MKKSRTITRLAIYMIIGQAIILVSLALLATFVFFRQSANTIYEEMDRSITGMALKSVDEAELSEIITEAYSIFEKIEDPRSMIKEDPEGYYARFRDLESSASYQKVRNTINAMRQGSASTCIQVVFLIPEKNYGIYVMDASDFNVLPCGDQFEYDGSDFINAHGRDFNSYISISETYGRVRTDGIPCCVNEASGIYSYILADIPISELTSKTRDFITNVGLTTLIATIIICAGVSIILKRKLIGPLEEVSEYSQKFVDTFEKTGGTFSQTNVFDGISGGEIVELENVADSLQTMEKEINTYLKNLEELTTEKARISTELELAESIQSNMLPNIFPPFPERREFDIYALMNPAREVGGDFYDFFLIDKDHLGLVIADVSGKGVPAALFMMMSKILVKNSSQIVDSPAKVLADVNNIICQNNNNDMFVTVWLGVMTIASGKVIAANAGHEYPILRRAGGSFEVIEDKHGLALGVFPNRSYPEYEIDLNAGDTLFVYTDGLPEATNSENKLFGLDRLKEVLNQEADSSLEDMFMGVGFAVAEFVQDAPQFDDITMLAVRRKHIPEDAETANG